MADERLRIKIEADAKKAERDLENIAKLANELTEDDLTILIDAKADAAQAEIRTLTKQLAEAEDPVDIKVITTGIAQARQQLEDLGKAGGNARKNVDDMNKSADSSKSVLANMVGNATQDLGALGGLAGSAGVAIGQMGEYMADAAAGGDKFGTIVKNFAAVAGPVALLSVGIGLATGAMSRMKKQAEESAARTTEFGEAMKTAADDSVGFADVITDSSDALRDFRVLGEDAAGGFGTFVDEMGSSIPLVGRFFKEASVDIIDASRRAGISVFDLSQEIANGAGTSDEFAARLRHAKDAGLITAKELEHVTDAVEDYGTEAAEASKKQNLFTVNQESANAALQEMVTKSKPMEKFVHLWDRLMADMADGTIDTNSTANAVNLLAKNLGMTQTEVIDLARAGLADQLEADAEAAEDAAAAVAEFDNVISGAEFGGTALEGATTAFAAFTEQRFAAGNKVQDEAAAWGAYNESLKDVSFSLDTTTEAGAKQQDALEDLATVVDTDLAQAYTDAGGDSEAFKAKAKGLADMLKNRLMNDMGLTEEQAGEVLAQLGLLDTDIETRYTLAGVEEAKLKLDLLSGSIDDLPKDVQAKVTQQIIAGDYVGALNTVQRYYDRNPATLWVQPKFKTRGGVGEFGAGSIGPQMVPVPPGPTATGMAATTTAAAAASSPGGSWTWSPTVSVKFRADTADVDRALRNLGGRTVKATADRYVWRNGRYLEAS